MNLTNRDFISIKDFDGSELEALLHHAAKMKADAREQKHLQDKNIGMLFSVASTRTRISFQIAARKLGATAEHYSAADLQMSNHESLKDTAAVMSRYLDALVVRMYDMSNYGAGRAALDTLAQYADIPVINALDDKDHPCQIMADLLTLYERYGQDYKRKKLVMSWGYSKRQKSPGVLHSMLSAAALLGMNVTFAYPEGFDLDPEYVAFADKAACRSGARIEFCNDLNTAATGADVIYVKNWMSLTMPKEQDAAYRETIKDQWCISGDHFKLANPGAYYMDCMPFIRGEQVTAEVADGPQSIIYDQAENRLHAQKAILTACISA